MLTQRHDILLRMSSEPIVRGVAALRKGRHLLMTAGAGMGVDSGLPDFRGVQGFWRAYPPYAKLGLRFEELANPAHFDTDPALAWGFYGQRLNLYRETVPHEGYAVLSRLCQGFRSCFVLTSNVDGQFEKAGFSSVYAIHGCIHELQCTRPYHEGCWSADGVEVVVNPDTMRAVSGLPRCPRCDSVARPRILMFGDARYVEGSGQRGDEAFAKWLKALGDDSLAVLEMGAGTGLPTIRRMGEVLARRHHGTLVRINPREAHVERGHVGIGLGALEALRLLEQAWPPGHER